MATVQLTLEELLTRLEEASATRSQSLTIGVRNPAVARYARALEYGSIGGQPPWPAPGTRTTLAVDPETGAQVVVSAQAPQGFLRVQAPAFSANLIGRLRQATNWLEAAAIGTHVEFAVREASTAALERIRAAAPRDSGQLAQSLEILPE